MKNNIFLKILSSIPIILVASYFIPFLGICLLILRYIIYDYKKKKLTPIVLIIIAFIILIPQVLKYILDMFKINVDNISYLYSIVDSKVYSVNFIKFSKFLITISVIVWILSFVFEKISNKISSGIKNYVQQDLKKDYEIRKENDLKMQEKREKAKNTHVVHCPYCGSDNMLTEQVGTCNFCRRKIQ